MLNDFINHTLNTIRIEFAASRVVVAGIHSNSFKNYEYYSKVFSVCNEVCSDGIPSIKHIVREIPLSVLEKEFEYYDGEFLLVDPNLIEDKKCLAHLENIGVKSMLNVLIKYKELIVGILSIQYCYEDKTPSCIWLTQETKSKLLKQIDLISPFI